MASKQIQEYDLVTLSSGDNLVIQNSTGSYKRFAGSDITTPLSSLAARVTSLEGVSMGTLYETAVDYAILDDDTYGYIVVDSRTGVKTITLPTLADNQGREITIMASYSGGAVIVDGEGAETIDGNAQFVIQNQYGFIRVKGTTSCWMSLGHKSVMETGWVNTSDWTDRTLGNITVNYNGSTGVFLNGEAIYESSAAASTTTGKGGIVVSASTLALILKNVTGGGTFTTAYFIHGETSSAGATVNGATKNVDTVLYHGMDRNFSDLSYRFYGSTTASFTASYHAYVAFQAANAEVGLILQQTSTNSLTGQTGEYGGFHNFDTSGNHVLWDSEDYFYNILIECIK